MYLVVSCYFMICIYILYIYSIYSILIMKNKINADISITSKLKDTSYKKKINVRFDIFI